LVGLLTLFFALLNFAAWGYDSIPSKDSYFKNTYAESRQAFLESAAILKKSAPNLELRTQTISSVAHLDLAVDSLYLPPKSGRGDRLLVLISGVHGIEGFVGSALQNYFMRENFWDLRDDNLGILIIHALNPYGFQQERRVTENNVDLNRNFDDSYKLFQNLNPGYQQVRGLLNPVGPAGSGFLSRCQFYFSAALAILEHSMDSLRRAVLKGQYEFPEGIYFGGNDFEPQKQWLQHELVLRSAGYRQILLVDLHTGYGSRGQLHLFGDRAPELDEGYLKKIFSGMEIDFGQKKDFYEVTGGLVVFTAKLLRGTSQFAGMVFEFGTLDSQKTLGSLDSIYRMVKENQLVHHGAESENDRQKIRDQFREMFYPSSLEWQSSVLQQFRDALSLALRNQRP
jgi:hypothetical protein